jgi:hypothetical protein
MFYGLVMRTRSERECAGVLPIKGESMRTVLTAAAACCVVISGCASVVRGVNEDVAIEVTPANAEIRTSAGHACTGPCVINVPRKKEFTVTASAPGYQTETIDIDTRISGKGAAGMAGNVIIGGVIGVGVDAVSGATLDHYPKPVPGKPVS